MSEEYLLKNTLKKIDYTTRWLGIPLEKNPGKFVKFIFNFIWVNTDVAGAICWFIVGAKKGESLTTLTYVAPCITLSFLADSKLLCLIIYNKHVINLISILKDLENKESKRDKSDVKTNMMKKDILFLHIILKVLNIANWALTISFPLMPLGLSIINYIKTNEFKPLLPLLIVYPFNAYDLRVYPFVFARQIWSVVLVVFGISSADCIFFICSTYLRIQFQLLAYEIEGLVGDNTSRHLSEEEVSRKLKNIINWHHQLIYAVELMEIIYSKSTLLNFVSSSALICLTGFNVTTIDDVPFVVSFLSFLFMSLLQIYFLCFFGDMLMRASVSVSDAAYNSKWYSTNKKIAKALLLILIRAQKACKLTAFGFADVNLMAFTRILSTAWSYFALLKTIYGSRN